ncbi:hypothetical protein D3C86_1745170 [compost metagenome]
MYISREILLLPVLGISLRHHPGQLAVNAGVLRNFRHMASPRLQSARSNRRLRQMVDDASQSGNPFQQFNNLRELIRQHKQVNGKILFRKI